MGTNSKACIDVSHVCVEFGGRAVLKDLSARFDIGLTCLGGKNGAGKTTLLRILAGVLRPNGGEVLYCGQDIHEMGMEYRRCLGYLPQNFGFYPDLTVEGYLYYIAALKGLRPIVTKRDTRRLLEEFRMTENKDRRMDEISGGQQERVGIIQALLNSPDILLLDEPLSSQDTLVRSMLLERLRRYAEDHTVILSTHLLEEASGWADKVVML